MESVKIIKDRYIMIKEIGQGGMADVYLGIDSILNKQVAIKLLRGDLNNDPVNLERFKREGQAITTITHPNVVEVYDVGEDEGKNYIVMEYVPGNTLKQLIKQRGALSQKEAVNIMKQLTSATAQAHAKGVIHRDIKSQNVLIKDDGTVKLSDFGIAITSNESQLTQTNTVMGSVHYLAPELAKGHRATVQSDIYSLGVVLYEMLVGDVPFHGESAVQVALRHMHDPLPSVRQQNPDIYQSVENIVIKACAKNPEDRYTCARDMLEDLETCLNYSRMRESKLVLDSRRQEKTEPVIKKRSNVLSTVVAVILAVALCAAVVLTVIILDRGSITEQQKVKIPDIINYSMSDASMILEQLDLVITKVEYKATDNFEKGAVIDVYPSVGIEVLAKSTVTLYVSEGKYYTVEKYVDKKIEDVKELLEDAGFTVNIEYSQTNKIKPGIIMDQSIKEGTVLHPTNDKKVIKLTVSSNVSFIVPYNIKGMKIEDAQKELEELGAVVTLVPLDPMENFDLQTETYIREINTVISVNPDINSTYTQKEDTSISIYYYPAIDVPQEEIDEPGQNS